MAMHRRVTPLLILIALGIGCLAGPPGLPAAEPPLVLVCRADNDLYRVLLENGIPCSRVDRPERAVEEALEGTGVLILADGYPTTPTEIAARLYEQAARKNIRLYVEYPASLPDLPVGPPVAPRQGEWGQLLDRVVVASEAFGPALATMRILMINDCHHVPVKAPAAHLVLARVTGFDTARCGLPPEGGAPILFEHPGGRVLVATTKLSQFVTARYAPTEAWAPVWQMILGWLRPGQIAPELRWVPTVRPTYGAQEALPKDFETLAIRRGTEWFVNSGLLVHPAWEDRYNRPANMGPATADWPFGHRSGPRPDPAGPGGDGSLGMLEGFRSRILYDGSQPVLWWRRHDCNAEVAGAMAMAGTWLGEERFGRIGGNIGDWLYGRSLLSQGDRANPDAGDFGLIGWNDVPNYYGAIHGYNAYYADDNARGMLGMIRAAAALKTDRWNERLAQCLLATMRLTSRRGFSPVRIDGPLAAESWRSSFEGDLSTFSPHDQAYLQACHLWAYRQTGDRLFLDRATSALRLSMEAYPDRWSWTNGQITLQRARFLLPLAWLVRVDDTPEHREWLARMVNDLLTDQVECGAIRSRIVASPTGNGTYGTGETALVDQNGDPASDLLYEANFALLGLREATAATGNPTYRKAEDRLAEYICRIQASSAVHPELDGAWYRGFDYRCWDYWGSDGDIGWGLWSIETGWTQGELLSTLILRQLDTSLWDYTADSNISVHLKAWRPRMLP